MIDWKSFIDFKSKVFLGGIATGAISAILICVLSVFLLHQTVLAPPIPLVTAEEVVEHGFGKIEINEDTKERTFIFYTYKDVNEKYNEIKKNERKEKFKNFFKKIGDFFKKPFSKN